jgi:ABC-type lipoprotein export system ATPase subunit
MSVLAHATDVWQVFPQPGGEVVALRDLQLQVRAGEFIAIRGSSGSGKSTLLAILGALEPASRGRVELFGRSLSSLNQRQRTELRRRRIGFVFQDFLLVRHLTALDNVRLPQLFGDAAAGDRADELLQRMDLQHRRRHRPHALSRGERQRVALARALVHRPELLLADEPTASLDPESGRNLGELLEQCRDQDRCTVVVATHDRELLARADRIVQLENGSIVADEPANSSDKEN